MYYKKVLLRERKRHTARRVASTPYVVLAGYPPARVPPSQGTPPARVPPGQGTPPARVPPWPGYPPARVGYPPGGQGTPPVRVPPARIPPGYPPARVPPQLDLAGYPPAAPWHSGKCCKALWDMGTPPLPHGILGNVAKHYGIWVPPPVDRQKDRHVSKHYLPVVLRTRAVIIRYFKHCACASPIKMGKLLSFKMGSRSFIL